MDAKNVVMALFAVALLASPAVAIEYSNMLVSSTLYDPYPAQAGQYTTVYFQLYNDGTSQAAAVSFTLKPDYPFSLPPGVNATQYFSGIAAGSSALVQYQLRVASDAVDGDNKLVYAFGEGGVVTNAYTTISVARTNNVRVTAVTPGVLKPGVKTPVVFTLENLGNSTAEGITLAWTDSTNLIVPVGSENRRTIVYMPPNGQANVSFDIMADPAMTPGAYLLNVTLSYNNANSAQTSSSKVGLVVGGTADLEVALQEYSATVFSVALANVGSTTASSVSVSLPRNSGLSVSGATTQFLGNLLKGDFTVASFSLSGATGTATTAGASAGAAGGRTSGFGGARAQATATVAAGAPSAADQASAFPAGNFSADRDIPVTVSYTDTLGVRHSTVYPITISRGGSFAGTALTGRARDAGYPWYYYAVGAVIVIVVGYFAYKRFFKKPAAPLPAAAAHVSKAEKR